MRHSLVSMVVLASIGCGSDQPPEPPRLEGEPRIIAPGSTLPSQVVSQVAHNNLDVVRFDGRVFFAFRTAPTHFASEAVEMFVVSSANEESWTFEAKISLGTDVREPRFLEVAGELYLYFALLGTNSTDFEPGEMRMIERQGAGSWTEPVKVYEDGFIPWRGRVENGEVRLIGYTGGGSIYDQDAEPLSVHWLTTTDGVTFTAALGGDPVVHTGGGSETDWAFLEDGTWVLVLRNEKGEGNEFGSKICRASAGALRDWTCVYDPKKYDSPLVFRHGERVYLVGRRNLTEDGAFDLNYDDYSQAEQFIANSAEYWFKPKRCSLWEVDVDTLEVSFVLDLPSRGDTCFASMLPGEVNAEGRTEYAFYNYTSPLNGEDVSWVEGQGGPTVIYRQVISFP